MRKKILAIAVAAAVALSATVASSAQAYGPSVLYSSPADAQEYGALYPKTVELQHNGAANGTLLATFEQVRTTNPVFPIYRSTDNGATWSKISEIADTVNGWGNRNGNFLYELPQQVGSLAAGTILSVGLSVPSDKSAERMEVYKSTDQGRTWQYLSRIASSGGYSTTPIWEPFVLVANGKLIVYYSDERDKANNNQKIVHQTSTDGVNWGPVIEDVAPDDTNLRPGMPVVSRMADGRYLMTYEVVNAPGLPNNYKISSNPESWNPTDLGTTIDYGGSPYNIVLPNGKILYNSYGSSDVLVNTGNGSGSWTPVKVKEAAGYSRTLQYVHATGRVLIMTCPGFFENNGQNKNVITYGDEDFGNSAGAYYKVVNRATGKVLGVNAGSLTDGANVVQWSDIGSQDQAWHMTTSSSGATVFGNRGSGRVLGVFQGSTSQGQSAVQWLDSGAADQSWTVTTVGSYVTIRNTKSGLYLGVQGGSSAEGAQIIQWPGDNSMNQQWQLVAVQ
ncbi:RICIN domain-containing protein [Rathayibacter sp. VKM Ac-2929]|uniref:RICIN domain-containing protein n=1 Tax=Rathayibacter sp. VKM Ac-2929 TaxID=2929480 RepID=UPI001FB3E877|nr:RICIN domain-containing protein [Rathayibacter sp. VKM Ac-2929]MCJ1675531.1 RICIN domain-containing protein [Rathayibacter sp. VKM Ac-2929]